MEWFNAENCLEYLVILYFINPYRQLLLKLCCANNVSVWNFNVSNDITNQSPFFPDC